MKKISNEHIFVLYYFGFLILKPFLQNFSEISTFILLGYTIGLVGYSILRDFPKIKIKKINLISLFIYLIIVTDLLLRPNSKTTNYLYLFTIYGSLPIYLISKVKNYEKLIKLFLRYSVGIFIFYARDPLNNYYYFGDYMSYGFSFILPVYLIFSITRDCFNTKKYLVFEMVALILMILYANRSASLSVIVFFIIKDIFFNKISLKKISKYIIGCTLAIFLILNLRKILKPIVDFLVQHGIESYSLRHFELYASMDKLDQLSSGRIEIWRIANKVIENNFILGTGIGGFQSKFGAYPHNLYFDLMTTHGVVGLIVFLVVITRCLINFKKMKGTKKYLTLIFFILWFPMLFFSQHMYEVSSLWIFITLTFKREREKNEYID